MPFWFEQKRSGRAHVDDVFALVPLLVVGAGAAGQMINVHVVDVACAAGHFDDFVGRIVGA